MPGYDARNDLVNAIDPDKLAAEGVSKQGQQRVASIMSPFEAEHFVGPVREEFVSQGGRGISPGGRECLKIDFPVKAVE